MLDRVFGNAAARRWSLVRPWRSSGSWRSVVSKLRYVKNTDVARSDFFAALGMGLIICGVLFFLLRDIRIHFRAVAQFFERFEERFAYVPFVAPGVVVLGLVFVFLSLVL